MLELFWLFEYTLIFKVPRLIQSLKLPSRVTIRWQCVFAFIPIINFWASYRIRKLRKYLLLCIALTGVNFVIWFFIPFGIWLGLAIHIPVTIHYMRKWSILWNKNFVWIVNISPPYWKSNVQQPSYAMFSLQLHDPLSHSRR